MVPRASGLGLDSREYRYLLGVVWETTAKMTGSVRVGGVTKKFDDPALPNYSAPNWEVAIRWSPRTYCIWDPEHPKGYLASPINLSGDATDTAEATPWAGITPRMEQSPPGVEAGRLETLLDVSVCDRRAFKRPRPHNTASP